MVMGMSTNKSNEPSLIGVLNSLDLRDKAMAPVTIPTVHLDHPKEI